MSSNTEYRSDINGLRGLAVLVVVLYHAFPNIFTGGFVGVDIFFVISGYLITRIILRDIKLNEFSFKKFYSRRVKRLFPPLIILLSSCIIFGWFLLPRIDNSFSRS